MMLVTGGLGFIGTHVVRSLLDSGESCVLAQRRAGELPEMLAAPAAGAEAGSADGPRAVLEQLDVADRAALLDLGTRHQITGIVHLADSALGPDGPVGNVRKGIGGLLNVLEAAAEWGVARVSIASSIGVYGGLDERVLQEDMLLPLASGHSIVTFKKVEEILADYLGPATGLDVVSCRIAGIWGPLGRPASAFVAAPQLVHAAARGTVPDFSTLRMPAYAESGIDLCYARDCGRAIALLQTAEHLNHRVYNVGSGRVTTNGEVAAAVRAVVPDANVDLPTITDDGSFDFIKDVCLDITRLSQDTGFTPEYDCERAVADYVAWLRAGNER